MPNLSSHSAVLWVDNDEKYPRLHQTQLEEKGFHVIHTRQGLQALARLHQQKFDLALVDTRLADIDGLDLVGQMAKTDRHMAIIIYTTNPFYEINFRSWAADAVLIKSKNTGELLNQMTYLLQQRAH
ncbi:MAG: Sensor histidine kinase RcsC [bacterium]|nr:Sensor histidine kinase RcsC [bacterium]